MHRSAGGASGGAVSRAQRSSVRPQAFLSDPKRSETENKFDIRFDHTIGGKDNFFARFSYGNDSFFLPSPFNNVLDGGSFQDGYSDNSARGLAASEVHTFRNNLINEFRFGFNHLNSHRYNLNYNVNVSQQLGFPGVPFGPNIGGLPSISFSDGTDERLAAPDICPPSKSSIAMFSPII